MVNIKSKKILMKNAFRNIILLLFLFTKGLSDNIYHPCLDIKLTESITQSDDPIFYNIENINKKPLKGFRSNMEYAYLYNQLIPIMKITRHIINVDYYIGTHNNPRYYFIKGMEDLMNNNLDSSKFYLSNFINFNDNYINSDSIYKSKYFQKGCSQSDIEWLEKTKLHTKEYKVATIVLKFLNSEINMESAIEQIDGIDDTDEIFDLYDNIILSLMKIDKSFKYADYKDFFDNQKYIKINQLLYEDNLDYYLSSQILALSLFNFFQAERDYNLLINSAKGLEGTFLSIKENELYNRDIKRKISNIAKYSNTYLFPLMYYFEMKLDHFSIYDTELYDFINLIIKEIETVKKDNFDPNYKTWLKIYQNDDSFDVLNNNFNSFAKNYFNKSNTYKSDEIFNSYKNLINTNINNVDSILFTKSFQKFNTLDFFFEISDSNELTTYWIPEIKDDFKQSFYNIEQLFFNELTFNEKSYPMTKKINISSLLFYYFYDYYIDNHSQQNIKFAIEVSSGSKHESGLYPLIDSINGHLKSILNP